MILSSGTWTPALWDSTLSNSESQTYTTQYGAWTKVGNRIFIHGTIEILSFGSLTQSDYTRIGDLPFTASATTNSGGSIIVTNAVSISLPAANMVSGIAAPSNNHIDIYMWTGTTVPDWVRLDELTSNGSLTFNGQYITDD